MKEFSDEEIRIFNEGDSSLGNQSLFVEWCTNYQLPIRSGVSISIQDPPLKSNDDSSISIQEPIL